MKVEAKLPRGIERTNGRWEGEKGNRRRASVFIVNLTHLKPPERGNLSQRLTSEWLW